jgi:hypothetical protein
VLDHHYIFLFFFLSIRIWMFVVLLILCSRVLSFFLSSVLIPSFRFGVFLSLTLISRTVRILRSQFLRNKKNVKIIDDRLILIKLSKKTAFLYIETVLFRQHAWFYWYLYIEDNKKKSC